MFFRYLHCNDNNAPHNNPTAPGRPDKLHKVRPFIQTLLNRFQTMLKPDSETTVDESMIRFKGRLGFRQYLPAKPIKWGIKVWALCCSTTGYMYRFQIYTGKEDGRAEQNLSSRVVKDLVKKYEYSRLRVYMDNFYTGVELLQELERDLKVYACGTVRANRRGLPSELKPTTLNLQKHQFRVAKKGMLSFAIWKDTKPVQVLSTVHQPEDMGTVRRRVDGARADVRVPKCIADYQKYMKGVDLCDQMVGYYMPNHRSKKWWRRIFFYFLSVTVHNSYLLAKRYLPAEAMAKWPSYLRFFQAVSEGLIGNAQAVREVPIAPAAVAAVHANHTMVKDAFGQKRKVCVECSLARAEGDPRAGATKCGCQECGIPVHEKCFARHTQRITNLQREEAQRQLAVQQN
jgi:hypothetical protein